MIVRCFQVVSSATTTLLVPVHLKERNAVDRGVDERYVARRVPFEVHAAGYLWAQPRKDSEVEGIINNVQSYSTREYIQHFLSLSHSVLGRSTYYHSWNNSPWDIFPSSPDVALWSLTLLSRQSTTS